MRRESERQMKLPKFFQTFFGKPKEPTEFELIENLMWTTLDGRTLPISCVTDLHLANIVSHVAKYEQRIGRATLNTVIMEAVKRGLSSEFLTKAPYPWQDVDGKWKVLDMEKREYRVIGR
jgi:hypothetical protein